MFFSIVEFWQGASGGLPDKFSGLSNIDHHEFSFDRMHEFSFDRMNDNSVNVDARTLVETRTSEVQIVSLQMAWSLGGDHQAHNEHGRRAFT